MKKKTIGKEYIFTALILFVVLAVTMVLDSQLPSYHIVIKVIKKASVYSLVAVSMNLLNGFTGLFSLGQAGFMLLGAYSYAVLCIPVAKRAGVYQYFDGGIVKFSLPEIFASFLGDKVGSAVGMILALLVGGLIAAFFAYLIGLPVLRLKSDYLAIATLGFAEIMRTIIQWNAIGPLTNASNLLKGYPDFSSATAYLLLIGVFIAESATFAAEVAGCQVECGAGSGMAAAGVALMLGGTVAQCLDAASMALQNITGLACDPVANRVEVPCLGKNIMCGFNAVACANMALAGFDKVIPLDETIAAVYDVGLMLPLDLRCTLGGLGKTPASFAIRKRLS